MRRRSTSDAWTAYLAIAVALLVVIGVFGTWVESGATNASTSRTTGFSGGNILIAICCLLIVVGLAAVAIQDLRMPSNAAIHDVFNRALLFGGIVGGVVCIARLLTASSLSVSSDGKTFGVWSHPGWGAWLTTGSFVVLVAGGVADRLTRRRAGVVSAAPSAEQSKALPAPAPTPEPLPDVVGLFQAAIISGGEANAEALLAAGPEGVDRLRDLLNGTLRLDLPPGNDRQLIDNVSALSCALASRYPAKYVAVFADLSWIRHGEVLIGLGYTQRPEAGPVLIAALSSTAPGVTRLRAAIALRYISGTASIAALQGALNDSDDLVRHHARESLIALGVSPSA